MFFFFIFTVFFRGGVSEVKRVPKVFMPRDREREHVGHSVSHFDRSNFPDRVERGGLIDVSLHLAVALLDGCQWVAFFLLCFRDLFKGLGGTERRGVGVLATLFSQPRCFWYVCQRVGRASAHGLFTSLIWPFCFSGAGGGD